METIVESYFGILQLFLVGYNIWFFIEVSLQTSCTMRFGGKDTIFLGDL